MFSEFLNAKLSLNYENRIIVFDYDNVLKNSGYQSHIEELGFAVIEYNDIEYFRYLYEKEIKQSKDKYLVIVNHEIYIPFDIRQVFYSIDLSLNNIFPKLNTFVLRSIKNVDYDLLYIGYENLYNDVSSEKSTKEFLDKGLYTNDIITEYVDALKKRLKLMLNKKCTYSSWQRIALYKARIEHISHKAGMIIDMREINNEISEKFSNFVINDYRYLSGYSYYKAPVILSKCMDYIFLNSKKFAIIVMDGMSIENWLTISEKFKDISYDIAFTFALIPTITAISRQSLLSGKLPVELPKPFDLSMEKKMFFQKCIENGYKEKEIEYRRGYDVDYIYGCKSLCIIINDIDDLIHSETQGRRGLYNNIVYLAKSNKLQKLVKNLIAEGFDVYITSDHGNTDSICIGNPKGNGIEVETKCKRVIIYRNYADYEKTKTQFDLHEYQGYYMPKNFRYLICKENEAFGVKNKEIISHGGKSIEEVIVPFIRIEG